MKRERKYTYTPMGCFFTHNFMTEEEKLFINYLQINSTR